MACRSSLLASGMINSGSLEKPLPVQDAGVQTVLSQLTGLPARQFLLAGMERCSVVALHIVLSYLVNLGVKNKKIQSYILAVIIHFLVDAGIVYAAGYVPVLELGLLAAVFVLAALAYAGYRREGAGNAAS